jgi:hypothetical protein
MNRVIGRALYGSNVDNSLGVWEAKDERPRCRWRDVVRIGELR